MLLSLIDPDLMIYEQEHWLDGHHHFFERIEALLLHRTFIRSNSLQIAISVDLAAAVYQAFPWNSAHRHVYELRDLRQFVLEDLHRASYLAEGEAEQATIEPDSVTCQHVRNDTASSSWKGLLAGCVEKEATSEFDFHIATHADSNVEPIKSLNVTIYNGGEGLSHQFPLIFNKDDWTVILASVDPWPDLEKCVEQYFLTNPGMQMLQGIKNPPDQFECTDSFLHSVNSLCTTTNTRQALIKAVAKRVYGVLDSGLHDEYLRGSGETRRFRVTEFWRIHYRRVGGIIVLEEFGEHNIGI